MKTEEIRIYDRKDSDIPFNSPMYILDTHDNFIVVKNLYGVTFHTEFDDRQSAINHYMKEIKSI